MNRDESDELVMSCLVGGDESALGVLMQRWGGQVWHFIDRLCGTLGQTDDLYQEVWTRLFLYRRRYDVLRPFAPYLFRIATNRCRSAMLRRGRWPESWPTSGEVVILAADNPEPIDILIDREEHALLHRAITRLPWMQRVVVLMYCLVSTDYRQIARALGRSTGTVRSHMHSAIKNLRASLERIAVSTESEVGHARPLHRAT